MDGEEIRFRLSQMVSDFEVRASKVDGLVSGEALTVVKKLVELAKETVPGDPILQAVELPTQPKYSDLYPILRQVVLALPETTPFA